MKIGIAFDLAPTDPALRQEGPDDRFEEFDKPETVEAIAEVIRGEGHEVVLLGDGREFLTRVLADPPDFVFNIAEGEGVGRCREARVPAVLEMLGIPYSGSDPLTLAACLDKDVARRLVKEGVSVPTGFLFDHKSIFRIEDRIGALFRGEIGEEVVGKDEFKLEPALPPLILKPAFEGSSKGIRGQCVAETKEEAGEIFRRLARDYDQPILIEQFIHGEEITVGLVGNRSGGPHNPEILGMMRVVPKQLEERFIYSLEVKRDWRNRVEYETPARVPDADSSRRSIPPMVGVLGSRLPRPRPDRLPGPRRRPLLHRGQPPARPGPGHERSRDPGPRLWNRVP